jgi:chromosomal replication initiation ATPase DnaA
VSAAFGVEPAELWVSRRRGNEARSAAIYLARRVTEKAGGVIGADFGGVSMTAISKTAAQVESQQRGDRAWDRRLREVSQRLARSNATPSENLRSEI